MATKLPDPSDDARSEEQADGIRAHAPTRKYPAGRAGTPAGYSAHKRAGEEPCDECRQAERARSRSHDGKSKLAPHAPTPRYPNGRAGTIGGYTAHYRAGEKPCAECQAAMTAYLGTPEARETQLRWRQSEAGQESMRRAVEKYTSSEHGQAALKEAQRRWYYSEKGQAKRERDRNNPEIQARNLEACRRYSASERGQAKHKAWRESERGQEVIKAAQERYRASEHGQAKQAALRASPEYKARLRVYMEEYNSRPGRKEAKREALQRYQKSRKGQLTRMRRRARRKAAVVDEGCDVTLEDLAAWFGPLCVWCGEAAAEHVDHVVALASGGEHAAVNLAPACPACNYSKSDRPAAGWLDRRAAEGRPVGPFAYLVASGGFRYPGPAAREHAA